jgi:hypothetical protein
MPNNAQAYYMLADAAEAAPGAVSGYDGDGQPERIAADPRRLMPSELLTTEPELALLEGRVRLLRLRPAGAVTESSGDRGRYECLAGWAVTAADDLSPVLGPQAAQILAVITRAEQAIAAGGGPDWDAYVDATDDIGRDDDTAEAFAAADTAARTALAVIGADSWFWATLVGTGAYGPEILALAARDLIGCAPGWTRAAYDLLTRPWSQAFGVAHPGDRVPAGAR